MSDTKVEENGRTFERSEAGFDLHQSHSDLFRVKISKSGPLWPVFAVSCAEERRMDTQDHAGSENARFLNLYHAHIRREFVAGRWQPEENQKTE